MTAGSGVSGFEGAPGMLPMSSQGAAPGSIQAKAPLRLSFAGGGTDVPPYTDGPGGAVLSATINRFSYATLQPTNGSRTRVESVDLNKILDCDGDADLEFDGTLDLAKAVLRRLGSDPWSRGRFSLRLQTDAPPGSGLGSSSAAVVAMLGVFREWLGLAWSREELARIACQIERGDLRIPGGYQDQYAAAYGGFNFMEFNSTVRVQPLRIDPDIVRELNDNLLLCFTGSVEHHFGIIEDQVNRLRSGAADVRAALDRTRVLAYDARDSLLRGDLNEFGEILDEAWEAKKHFSRAITNDTLDAIYAGAKAAGARGGKITGAGGGGHMMFLCDSRRRQDVVTFLASRGLPLVHYAFEGAGLRVWKVS